MKSKGIMVNDDFETKHFQITTIVICFIMNILDGTDALVL